MIGQYILLALGFAAWAASLVFIFKPRWWAAPLAWLALYTTMVGPILLPEKKTNLGADQTSLMGKLEE